MAKPRVFVSSTYYDLKHLRSSLENFVEALGFEPVLSEKGDIAFSPDVPLDESCYREARNADLFVLIIGGRYGSEASSVDKKPTKAFFDRYDSITKQEYKNALANNIPTYILIESNVYSEYFTFLKNKDNKKIRYAHVDSVNIFHLISDILAQPKNNPVFAFERYGEIEDWLREQWAGLFKEFISRLSGQEQIETLASKVSELGEITITLRRYMEAIIEKVSPQESGDLIEAENKRLQQAQIDDALKRNRFFEACLLPIGAPFEELKDVLEKATSLQDFVTRVGELADAKKRPSIIEELLDKPGAPLNDLNEARKIAGKEEFKEKGLTNSSN